jgi:dTDP-4-amino-4,6-dideoxygalactose transaminase
MKNITIPLIDLKKQYKFLENTLEKKILQILSSTQYILGDNTAQFEHEFANYIGTKHAISVANGTDALVISLRALGIGSGDEVITTPFTFFATAESIALVGATPVFVDIEQDTYNIDVSKIEQKITSKTKAIMPVHIFGTPANMKDIIDLAKQYNLKIIEDACQAIGAKYKGKRVGTWSDVACFSFFPTKNLGCAGDGGMIVTNDDRIATIVRALRSHGSGKDGKAAYELLNNKTEDLKVEQQYDDTIYNPFKYYNYLIGYNSRLDSLQAGILSVKLPYIDEWNEKRRQHADYYNQHLKTTSLVLPKSNAEDCEVVYHLYIVQSEKRQELTSYLNEKGISTGIYYPIPLHFQKAFEYLGYQKGDFPICENISDRSFAIPIYPELTEGELSYIVNTIKEWEMCCGK